MGLRVAGSFADERAPKIGSLNAGSCRKRLGIVTGRTSMPLGKFRSGVRSNLIIQCCQRKAILILRVGVPDGGVCLLIFSLAQLNN